MKLTINIPDDKVDLVIAATIAKYPIPYTDKAHPKVPDFTPLQWVKESVRRTIRDNVNEYRMEQATQSAVDNLTLDDDIAS